MTQPNNPNHTNAMSYPFQPVLKLQSLDQLTAYFRSVAAQFPDPRFGDNIQYTMEEVGLSAFSVFFMQSASFLEFQRTLQSAKGCNNASALFGLDHIASDNHIRSLLDPVPPSELSPMYQAILTALNSGGHLEAYRSTRHDLLVALDGTQYFSSNRLHCEQCNTQQHDNGHITYSHTAITPIILAPSHPEVIALEPEFITPQDGHEKQDCENTAAKRWLEQHGPRMRELGVTILGDDLYCKQPLCQAILDQGLNFILVCQPTSHTTLYEWVDGLETTGGVQTHQVSYRKGKHHYTDTYRFVNEVRLKAGDEALYVNWCELRSVRDDSVVVYKNAFATNHQITPANVVDIVRDGRARWKIENENNNTLKTKGYDLSHNFGHGKQHLSSLLASLNILAFLFHTVLALCDRQYQCLRECLPRKSFFNDLRALTRYLCFDSWEVLLCFMITQLELTPPDTS